MYEQNARVYISKNIYTQYLHIHIEYVAAFHLHSKNEIHIPPASPGKPNKVGFKRSDLNGL